MNTATPPHDRGSITLLAAVAAVALLLAIGLAVDGGTKIHAAALANSYAAAAARTGGQAIDTPTAIAGGPIHLDTTAAATAARTYLHTARVHGTVHITGPATITVDVTITRATAFLGLAGINTVTGHGHATAHLLTGTTTPTGDTP